MNNNNNNNIVENHLEYQDEQDIKELKKKVKKITKKYNMERSKPTSSSHSVINLSLIGTILTFSLSIWSFCFLYTLFSLPENWEARASWLLPEGQYTHDALKLNSDERMILAISVSFMVLITVWIGFLIHLIPGFSQRKLTNQSTLINIVKNYIGVIISGLIFGVTLYSMCSYCYINQLGLIYDISSRFFTGANGFSRVTAGFFSSILILSYLDPFNIKKYLGFKSKPVNTSNYFIGLFSLTGLGGMGGVAGSFTLIFIDLTHQLMNGISSMITLLFLRESSVTIVSTIITTFLCCAIFYYYKLRPNYAKSVNQFDRKSVHFEAKRRKLFPGPYPNGWYRLANSNEVKKGEHINLSALGRDFVVFRGNDGEVGVLKAHCPHLGAHLGVGGQVVDNTMECPFHFWRFNKDGECEHIPYLGEENKIPCITQTKSYHVTEMYKMIFIWFDAEDREPLYEIDEIDELLDGSMYYGGVTCLRFDQHVSEMHENSADYHHFNTLHAPLPIPILSKFINLRYNTRLYFPEDKEKWYVALFDNYASMYLLDKLRLSKDEYTKVTFFGPSMMFFEINTMFGKIRIIKTLLPESSFVQRMQDSWYAEKTVPRWLGWLIAYIGKNALDQDRTVWENKVYNPKPVLVKNDGPFPVFRRWYKKFYSENSPKVSNNYLEW